MSELAMAGAALLRAVDEFWGEAWDLVADARVEIRSRAPEAREWSLDEVHEYDGTGGLRRSVFYDQGRPWLLRENEYGLADCAARRTSRDLEEGTWTSWTYREGSFEGRPAVIAEVESDRERGLRAGGRASKRELYLLDRAGLVERHGSEEELRAGPGCWRVARDREGRVVERSVEGEGGRTLVAWRLELDHIGLPLRELRLGAGGKVEEERRFERDYDEEGGWRRERVLLAEPALGPLFAAETTLRARVVSAASPGGECLTDPSFA